MVTIIKAIYKFLKVVVPWLWKIAVFSFKMVIISFGSWVKNIPGLVRQIAADWTRKAEASKVPIEYDQFLYYGSVAIALIMVIVGWVFSAYLTVWLIHIIFK